MAEQLFRDVVSPTITVGSRARSTVVLSAAAHVALIATALISPLVASGTLPAVREMVTFVASASTPVPPPPPAPAAKRIDTTRVVQPADPHVAPVVAPSMIEPEREPPVTAREPLNDVVDSLGRGLPDRAVVPSVPVEPPPAPPIAPVRQGGDIRMPAKVKDVPPAYPAIAQASRVEGVVIVEATIGTGGDVENARVLRGHPLLDEAALAAVRQWRYSPTLLNGVPVSVIVTVTVRFALR